MSQHGVLPPSQLLVSQSVKTTLNLDVRNASHAASFRTLLRFLRRMDELIVFLGPISVVTRSLVERTPKFSPFHPVLHPSAIVVVDRLPFVRSAR